MNWQKLFDRLNLAHHIAAHLVGEEHTPKHHRIIGIGIMVIGVILAKLSHVLPPLLHILTDLIGYSLHGIGLMPFASYVDQLKQKTHSKDTENEHTANH